MNRDELRPRMEVWWTEVTRHGECIERVGRYVEMYEPNGNALVATQGFDNALYGIEPHRLRRSR